MPTCSSFQRDTGYKRSWKSHLQNALSEMMAQTIINGVSETSLSRSMPVMRVVLMPPLALARRDHTKAWEHLVVNDEGELDRLAAEASGLADWGELYTDKFPGSRVAWKKSRPMR